MWLDLGFPIQTDASGRRYKPLFAILCTDLDGKLNLNAQGNLSHRRVGAPGYSDCAVARHRCPGCRAPVRIEHVCHAAKVTVRRKSV